MRKSARSHESGRRPTRQTLRALFKFHSAPALVRAGDHQWPLSRLTILSFQSAPALVRAGDRKRLVIRPLHPRFNPRRLS